jgi:hypothetical protein
MFLSWFAGLFSYMGFQLLLEELNLNRLLCNSKVTCVRETRNEHRILVVKSPCKMLTWKTDKDTGG